MSGGRKNLKKGCRGDMMEEQFYRQGVFGKGSGSVQKTCCRGGGGGKGVRL